jgi:hypothetical protein
VTKCGSPASEASKETWGLVEFESEAAELRPGTLIDAKELRLGVGAVVPGNAQLTLEVADNVEEATSLCAGPRPPERHIRR